MNYRKKIIELLYGIRSQKTLEYLYGLMRALVEGGDN